MFGILARPELLLDVLQLAEHISAAMGPLLAAAASSLLSSQGQQAAANAVSNLVGSLRRSIIAASRLARLHKRLPEEGASARQLHGRRGSDLRRALAAAEPQGGHDSLETRLSTLAGLSKSPYNALKFVMLTDPAAVCAATPLQQLNSPGGQTDALRDHAATALAHCASSLAGVIRVALPNSNAASY